MHRGTVPRSWSAPPIGCKPVTLFADLPRIECRHCCCQPVVPVPFADSRRSYTWSFAPSFPSSQLGNALAARLCLATGGSQEIARNPVLGCHDDLRPSGGADAGRSPRPLRSGASRRVRAQAGAWARGAKVGNSFYHFSTSLNCHQFCCRSFRTMAKCASLTPKVTRRRPETFDLKSRLIRRRG